MKVGANVPVCGVLPRLDRLIESLREGTRLPFIGENDCVLWCTIPLGGGDDIVVVVGDANVDFDLTWLGEGAGEGDSEALLKGCARHRGPFCAGTDISRCCMLCVNTGVQGYTRIVL
jgi:hypothetical protein